MNVHPLTSPPKIDYKPIKIYIMTKLCKYFFVDEGRSHNPAYKLSKGTLLSLMLAACTASFTACNSEESLPAQGNQLQLSFGVNAPESRHPKGCHTSRQFPGRCQARRIRGLPQPRIHRYHNRRHTDMVAQRRFSNPH